MVLNLGMLSASMTPWIIAAAVVFLTAIHRKISVFKGITKVQMALGLLLVGAVVTGSLAGLMGAPSASVYSAPESLYAPTKVTDIDITTAFTATDGPDSTGEDPSSAYRQYLRANTNGTTDIAGDIDTGILTVYRQGSRAETCPVKCSSPTFTSASDSSDTTIYHLLNRNTRDEHYCYLKAGGAAGTTDPKEQTVLGFTEGAASATLGVEIDIDETALAEMANYTTKTITVDICGKPFYFDVTKLS